MDADFQNWDEVARRRRRALRVRRWSAEEENCPQITQMDADFQNGSREARSEVRDNHPATDVSRIGDSQTMAVPIRRLGTSPHGLPPSTHDENGTMLWLATLGTALRAVRSGVLMANHVFREVSARPADGTECHPYRPRTRWLDKRSIDRLFQFFFPAFLICGNLRNLRTILLPFQTLRNT